MISLQVLNLDVLHEQHLAASGSTCVPFAPVPFEVPSEKAMTLFASCCIGTSSAGLFLKKPTVQWRMSMSADTSTNKRLTRLEHELDLFERHHGKVLWSDNVRDAESKPGHNVLVRDRLVALHPAKQRVGRCVFGLWRVLARSTKPCGQPAYERSKEPARTGRAGRLRRASPRGAWWRMAHAERHTSRAWAGAG